MPFLILFALSYAVPSYSADFDRLCRQLRRMVSWSSATSDKESLSTLRLYQQRMLEAFRLAKTKDQVLKVLAFRFNPEHLSRHHYEINDNPLSPSFLGDDLVYDNALVRENQAILQQVYPVALDRLRTLAPSPEDIGHLISLYLNSVEPNGVSGLDMQTLGKFIKVFFKARPTLAQANSLILGEFAEPNASIRELPKAVYVYFLEEAARAGLPAELLQSRTPLGRAMVGICRASLSLLGYRAPDIQR